MPSKLVLTTCCRDSRVDLFGIRRPSVSAARCAIPGVARMAAAVSSVCSTPVGDTYCWCEPDNRRDSGLLGVAQLSRCLVARRRPKRNKQGHADEDSETPTSNHLRRPITPR